jgi:hypothetical protein
MIKGKLAIIGEMKIDDEELTGAFIECSVEELKAGRDLFGDDVVILRFGNPPNRKIEILETIAEDMRNDAAYYEGRDFTGKNVATYFGKQGAAIAALARIVKSIMEKK